jgi:hypothetical protein
MLAKRDFGLLKPFINQPNQYEKTFIIIFATHLAALGFT